MPVNGILNSIKVHLREVKLTLVRDSKKSFKEFEEQRLNNYISKLDIMENLQLRLFNFTVLYPVIIIKTINFFITTQIPR